MPLHRRARVLRLFQQRAGRAGACLSFAAMSDAPAPSTVLLVDDEPELRALLAEYFGRNGFTVLQAENAAAARARVAEQVPDVAVLDINMPGENGLSLARALREAHPRLGLVMLTTAGEADAHLSTCRVCRPGER